MISHPTRHVLRPLVLAALLGAAHGAAPEHFDVHLGLSFLQGSPANGTAVLEPGNATDYVE